jgi:hypothetical protein
MVQINGANGVPKTVHNVMTWVALLANLNSI